MWGIIAAFGAVDATGCGSLHAQTPRELLLCHSVDSGSVAVPDDA
jgi:hypothetical protein